jgi:ectoine hydroxylase-related dioxygenase (phytanoyl-CoA dioxygenase family)
MTAQPLAAGSATFELTRQQITFFETFGFVKLPGLFADDIERINDGFEAVFADDANQQIVTNVDLHDNQQRRIILSFIDRDPRLSWIRDDERVVSIVRSLIGPEYEYAESDGNLFSCESHWHADNYGAPIDRYHIKFSFYLDPLSAESGAIRMMPGTNHYETEYARRLRGFSFEPSRIKDTLGVEPRDLPSYTIESTPGDVIVWNYRTIHASYHGGNRRRLFSVSFRELDRA